MLPQGFIARVQEVKRLMPRSRKINWALVLATSLQAEFQREKFNPDSWNETLITGQEYTFRETGIELEANNFIPF